MAGPHEYAEERADEATRMAFPHVGVVTSAPSKQSDDPVQAVKVTGVTFVGETTAEVSVPSEGDVNPPTEGTRVLVLFQRGEEPLVVAQLYSETEGSQTTAPPYEPGERRIGHPATDANVHFKTDGTVVVESANGASTVEVAADGTVSINGGSTGVVTDVTTTKDADDHVTDVSVKRSSNIQVPK